MSELSHPGGNSTEQCTHTALQCDCISTLIIIQILINIQDNSSSWSDDYLSAPPLTVGRLSGGTADGLLSDKMHWQPDEEIQKIKYKFNGNFKCYIRYIRQIIIIENMLHGDAVHCCSLHFISHPHIIPPFHHTNTIPYNSTFIQSFHHQFTTALIMSSGMLRLTE